MSPCHHIPSTLGHCCLGGNLSTDRRQSSLHDVVAFVKQFGSLVLMAACFFDWTPWCLMLQKRINPILRGWDRETGVKNVLKILRVKDFNMRWGNFCYRDRQYCLQHFLYSSFYFPDTYLSEPSVKEGFSKGDCFLQFYSCTDRHKKKFSDKVRQ